MKKFGKQLTLNNNKMNGKLAESNYAMSRRFEGYEVIRTGRGSDYKERKVDWLTRQKGPWTHVEVKSSRTAPLSKLQKKTEKKTKRYRVHRNASFF